MKRKQRLYNHLVQIARERDPYIASGGHFFVREYIRQQLAQWGVVETHEFKVKSQTHQNLILDLPSTERANLDLPPILIGAHYDAVPGTPGADDNATGVAVLLELAATFAVQPPQYPVRLVAFDLEEYGLLGSMAYAAELKKRRQKLKLMLSLEMLGYCNPNANSQTYPKIIKPLYRKRGDFIALVGNLVATFPLIRLYRQMVKYGTICQVLIDPSNGKWIPITGFSDHYSFWQQGYPAVMVTDTAMLRNPHYHKTSDTVDTLDLDFLTTVCNSLALGIGVNSNLS